VDCGQEVTIGGYKVSRSASIEFPLMTSMRYGKTSCASLRQMAEICPGLGSASTLPGFPLCPELFREKTVGSFDPRSHFPRSARQPANNAPQLRTSSMEPRLLVEINRPPQCASNVTRWLVNFRQRDNARLVHAYPMRYPMRYPMPTS
jgi:hypothetical protein